MSLILISCYLVVAVAIECIQQTPTAIRDCQIGSGSCNFCVAETKDVINNEVLVDEIFTVIGTVVTCLGIVGSFFLWVVSRCRRRYMASHSNGENLLMSIDDE